MTNKQFLILSKAKDLIKAIPAIKYVGYYPDNVYNIGQQYPACILRDGDENETDIFTGNTLMYSYQFDIILHHELNQNPRIQDILDLQVAIITAIYAGLDAATNCTVITNHSVSKGDVQDALLTTGSGYQGEIASRVITFTLTVKDTRS